ncbi:cation:proton antiporter [Halorubrum lacusprofundi]|uniref:Sodium/hydrogen exchanger n=1 Tax=Halorubrum lacusprofundi (strain ATCC 49239 / DSM 5036 / JCM 8891 / ACAM 34) TaxID=416348 RepID=B9LRZ7_HALLT|nr:cation:proton antiporter [Halorubrum lacusprofundi]ACM57871.1 sodium/hydrogen exchanger [Halorubrum lacusprofundi ATCC 49239]MCG1006976.1 cation:proton antiporter [Halorubrum lacusprofundi]
MADILLVVGVTLLVAFVFGEALERVGEPALVGEIIAGLVLGPSIIGLIDYDETFAVFGIIGAMLLFFDIGYEHLDLTELLSVGSAAVSIALFGMIIPAGTGLALGLAFDYSVTESAFLALALSVTSIAVTARTLLDLHQLDSRVGHRVVGAAVVDDIVGLVAFALLLLAVSGGGTIEAVTTLGQVIGFFALAVIARFAVIQQLSSLLARSRQIEADILALFGVVFLVSFSAEAVGLDVTLGALMIGLLVGEDERLSRLEVREGIAGIAYGMFIPLFFAGVGAQIDLRVLTTLDTFVIAVVTFGLAAKFVGGFIGNLIAGGDVHESAAIGVGMTPKAGVELAIISAALAEGLISIRLFSAIAALVLVSVLISPSLLQAVLNRTNSPE